MQESPPAVGQRENGRERQVGAVLLMGFVRKGRGEGRRQLEKDGQSRGKFFNFFFDRAALFVESQFAVQGWKLGPWQ